MRHIPDGRPRAALNDQGRPRSNTTLMGLAEVAGVRGLVALASTVHMGERRGDAEGQDRQTEQADEEAVTRTSAHPARASFRQTMVNS